MGSVLSAWLLHFGENPLFLTGSPSTSTQFEADIDLILISPYHPTT